MSPAQIIEHYKEVQKDYNNKLADELLINRHAQHSKDIKKIYKSLRQSASGQKKAMSPDEFVKAMQNAMRGGI